MAAVDSAQEEAPEQRGRFPSAASEGGGAHVAEGAVLPGLGEGAPGPSEEGRGGGGWGESTRPTTTGLRVRHLRNLSHCSSCSIESAGGAPCPDPPGTQPAELEGSRSARGRSAVRALGLALTCVDVAMLRHRLA